MANAAIIETTTEVGTMCANAKTLRQAIDLARKVVPTRAMLPVLSGVLLDGTYGRIVATDMEITIEIKLELGADVAIVAPAKLLSDVLKSHTGAVSLHVDGTTLAVRGDGRETVIQGWPASDMPTCAPAAGSLHTFGVPVDTWQGLAAAVSSSVGKDQTRPILCGILCDFDGGAVRMTATDSYRLSTAAAVYYPHATDTGLHAIIPAKALAILGQASKGAKVWQGMEYIPATHVHVGADDKYVSLEIGPVCVSVRPVDGQYPNYKQLIPETFEHTFTLDRAALLDAVRSVGAMAKKNAPIRLLFADDGHGCKVSATTQDVGESSASVPFAGTATYTPVTRTLGYYPNDPRNTEDPTELDHMEIGFNPAFLADGLATFAGQTIDLQVIDPLRPLTIVEGEHTFLLMPVRLSS